ncbi:unnamed protein product [Microthlaspi erraticum]|uniref:Uncharacterized protein n=1 Tax=Microthlaspi erraticum TaxID=1685480 RepID=A0A6D2J5H7_9BRAS|nr:unnamed protein product [Microthlaspi erraticum]
MDPPTNGSSSNSVNDFTFAEIEDMESMYKEYGDQSLTTETFVKSLFAALGRELEESWCFKLKQPNQADSRISHLLLRFLTCQISVLPKMLKIPLFKNWKMRHFILGVL